MQYLASSNAKQKKCKATQGDMAARRLKGPGLILEQTYYSYFCDFCLPHGRPGRAQRVSSDLGRGVMFFRILFSPAALTWIIVFDTRNC